MNESTAVFLLCRKKNQYISALEKTLLNHVKVFIIEDNYNDIDPAFNGLCHTELVVDSVNIRYKTTAWDNAFYFIINYLSLTGLDYFYFIEDDVYSKEPDVFVKLIKKYSDVNYDLISKSIYSKKDSKDWFWWNNDQDIQYFHDPYRSFNPLCRLSKNLMQKIYNYQFKYGRFFYHEFFLLLYVRNIIYLC